MIPNMWYAMALSREVKKKPLALRRGGEDLVLWRDEAGKVVVMRDRCPHRSAQLSLGRVVDGNIECAFHGFRFDGHGVLTLAPANGRNGAKPANFRCGMKASREAHGLIWIWNGEERAEYPALPWFDNLEGMQWAAFKVEWDTHYTRMLEGVLDVSHLPFVHKRTIGRGNRTLVNGPYTTLEDGKMRIWVTNQPDAGLPAMKPTEVPPPTIEPSLYFNFPNVWQLRLSDKLRNVVVAAPIDDDHTMIYTMIFQSMVRTPVVSWAYMEMMNLANRYILSEDYKVTRSQRPKRSGLEIGENFIPADRPIALYLRERRDLMHAAGIRE
jgi:phenylpropionate dioxygenase-like ring-hydroxylating dioxygenase large terminal subunit